jgi:hypothetical protein
MLLGRRWRLHCRDADVKSRAEQYRQLARDFHFMARSLPHGQNRSTAEECERLADEQEQTTDLRQKGSRRVRTHEIRLAENPIHERRHEDGQKQD